MLSSPRSPSTWIGEVAKTLIVSPAFTAAPFSSFVTSSTMRLCDGSTNVADAPEEDSIMIDTGPALGFCKASAPNPPGGNGGIGLNVAVDRVRSWKIGSVRASSAWLGTLTGVPRRYE